MLYDASGIVMQMGRTMLRAGESGWRYVAQLECRRYRMETGGIAVAIPPLFARPDGLTGNRQANAPIIRLLSVFADTIRVR